MGIKLSQTRLPQFVNQLLRAPCHLSAFRQTVGRIPVLLLTQHKVLVHLLAMLTNEEGSAFQGGGGDAELIDMGDIGAAKAPPAVEASAASRAPWWPVVVVLEVP